jgi:hypothetical protein
MITTTQVRAIINAHRTSTYGLYTNKTAGYTGDIRRVKCYFKGDVKLVVALQKAAGKANVYLTEGSGSCFGGGASIIVKCVIG